MRWWQKRTLSPKHILMCVLFLLWHVRMSSILQTTKLPFAFFFDCLQVGLPLRDIKALLYSTLHLLLTPLQIQHNTTASHLTINLILTPAVICTQLNLTTLLDSWQQKGCNKMSLFLSLTLKVIYVNMRNLHKTKRFIAVSLNFEPIQWRISILEGARVCLRSNQRKHVSILQPLTPLTKISPRSSRTKPHSARILRVSSGTWMRPLTPVLSMRLARFTVDPQMSYWGLVAPITPATTGPWAMPVPSATQAWSGFPHLLQHEIQELLKDFLAQNTYWVVTLHE